VLLAATPSHHWYHVRPDRLVLERETAGEVEHVDARVARDDDLVLSG
jgi:hypothetical protein